MKIRFFFILMALSAVFAFADDTPGNRHVYIAGTASNPAHMAFFLENFKLEAQATGFFAEEKRENAAYTYQFDVTPNIITYDDGTSAPAPAGEPQFLIQITLIRNADSGEIVSFGFPFTSLDQMLEYNQYLFLRAAVNIPDEARLATALPSPPDDDSWRHKWLYMRISLDFPINFYIVQPKGLFEDTAVYKGDISAPDWFAPIDNRYTIWPAVTLGAEVQLLNYLSIEPKILISMQQLNKIDFITMTAGIDVKAPLKFFHHVMLQPYASFAYPLPVFIPLNPPDAQNIFASHPLFGVGGGVDIGIKAGKTGILFVDINYKYFFGDFGIANPHFDEDDHRTKPTVITYQRAVIGLALGYKFGFWGK